MNNNDFPATWLSMSIFNCGHYIVAGPSSVQPSNDSLSVYMTMSYCYVDTYT